MRAPLELFYNFHWVVRDEAARSAQAYAGFLDTLLTRNRIRGLVNLRGSHPTIGWWRYERRVCERTGVTHLNVALDSRMLPSRVVLASLLDAFDAAPRPFLIKCSGGQDRTSFAAALYVVHRSGWHARDAALAQFASLPYLHFPRRNQRWLRKFLSYAEASAQGGPVSDWVRRDYDPQAFAVWLSENGMADHFKDTGAEPGSAFPAGSG